MKKKYITYKITPELQSRIYQVASELPPMGKMVNGKPVYKSVQVPGTQVRKEDLKPGTPVIPNAMYKINQLQYVNHVTEMCALVRKSGSMAIDVYQSDVLALHRMLIQNDKKLNSPINKLKSWIKTQLKRSRA